MTATMKGGVAYKARPDTLVEVAFFICGFHADDFHGDSNASGRQIFENCLPIFQRDGARRKNARRISREVLDKQGSHVGGGVGDRRKRQAALPDLK